MPSPLSPDSASGGPTLSVVIVNHDGASDTLACISSIFRHPPSATFEIVLVDNCSEDGLVAAVAARFPAVRVVVNTRREGFARNYNRGFTLARGDYLLALNNDTIIHPGALDYLLRSLQIWPGMGMVGPRLLGRAGRTQIDCARRAPRPAMYIRDQLLTDMGLPLGWVFGRALAWRNARRRSGPVEAISGACMLVARDALAQVGLLDEGYRFYYEDTDWCRRFTAHGYQIGYVAEALITHIGDQSARKVKVWAKQQEYLGAVRYFRRHWALSARGVFCLKWATAYNWLVRGAVMLLAEAFTGRAVGARAYLYLWQWLLNLDEAGPAV